MALQTKAIKRRIKSVANTKKITKAMELVAASKMRRSVESVLASRPYSGLAWNSVQAISRVRDIERHPLMKENKNAEKILVILIASDRGLAGGFNTNMIKKTMNLFDALSLPVETICIGKKGADAMRRQNVPILASFTDLTNSPKFEEILPIGKLLVDEYTKKVYAKVIIAYTDFVSTLTQKPAVLDLLPYGSKKMLDAIGQIEGKGTEIIEEPETEYLFEPDSRAVLDRLLPRLVETMLYQAVLESSASEHSARMLAMRSASDAAEEMIESLTFTFNQARQASITQEIAEISAGKAALE